MREVFVHWLNSHGVPVEIIVLIISMLPIFELRGGIPVGFILKIAWWKTYLIAVFGNLILIPPVLFFLDPVSNALRSRMKLADRFFEWLFARTRRKTEAGLRRYGLFLGLMFFVSIPLPVTGAWTGCVAAFIFGIKFRYAFPSISLGVLIASIIVSILTYGASTVISFI